MINNGISVKTVLLYSFMMVAAFLGMFSMSYAYSRFFTDYDAAQNAEALPIGEARPALILNLDDMRPRSVKFTFKAPGAKQVFLHADFNLWGAHEIELSETAKDTFSKTLVLPQGEYNYYYSVDGEYTPDASAESVFYKGQEVSVKTVL